MCVRGFRPVISDTNYSHEKVNNFACSSHRISMFLQFRRDFVIRKLVRKQRILKYTCCFAKISKHFLFRETIYSCHVFAFPHVRRFGFFPSYLWTTALEIYTCIYILVNFRVSTIILFFYEYSFLQFNFRSIFHIAISD